MITFLAFCCGAAAGVIVGAVCIMASEEDFE